MCPVNYYYNALYCVKRFNSVSTVENLKEIVHALFRAVRPKSIDLNETFVTCVVLRVIIAANTIRLNIIIIKKKINTVADNIRSLFVDNIPFPSLFTYTHET